VERPVGGGKWPLCTLGACRLVGPEVSAGAHARPVCVFLAAAVGGLAREGPAGCGAENLFCYWWSPRGRNPRRRQRSRRICHQKCGCRLSPTTSGSSTYAARSRVLLDEPLLVDPPVGFAHRYRARDTWPLTLIPVTVRGPVRSLPLPTPAPAPAAPPRPLSSLTFNYVKTTHRVVSDSDTALVRRYGLRIITVC